MIRIGYELRDSLNTAGAHGGEGGVFNFNGAYLNGPLDNAATPPLIASGLAGLMLGISTNSYVNFNASSAGVVHTSSLYFQDDCKVNDRLTLNFGLRYEYESAPVERFDRGVRGFDYDVSSPVEAAARAAYTRNQGPLTASLPTSAGVSASRTRSSERPITSAGPSEFSV